MHNMPKSRTNFDAVRHWCGTSTGLTCSKSESLSGPAVPSCRVQGRLTQLPLASLGLSCPDGLPANLSGLSALQTLDLAFNNLSSTTDRLAEVNLGGGAWAVSVTVLWLHDQRQDLMLPLEGGLYMSTYIGSP